jgi:heat shock protein HslJ
MKNTILLLSIITMVSSCKPRKEEPFGRITKLEDKKWILYSLNGKEMAEKDSSKMFTLEIFSEDNAVYLNSVCDTTYGLYTATNDNIFINVLGRTNPKCNPDLFGEYVQQAKSANHFQIKSTKNNNQKSEQLILFNDDQELMRLNKK